VRPNPTPKPPTAAAVVKANSLREIRLRSLLLAISIDVPSRAANQCVRDIEPAVLSRTQRESAPYDCPGHYSFACELTSKYLHGYADRPVYLRSQSRCPHRRCLAGSAPDLWPYAFSGYRCAGTSRDRIVRMVSPRRPRRNHRRAQVRKEQIRCGAYLQAKTQRTRI
jgi:hypothetical protein